MDDAVREMTFAAISPLDVKMAQSDLMAWCIQKIKALRTELADQRKNLQIAQASKWRSEPWKRQIARTTARITYYDKIRKAISLGYLIIPNFPIDVFAIRTARTAPYGQMMTNQYEAFRQSAQCLPIGQGEYVSEIPEVSERTFPVHDDKTGEVKAKTHYYPKRFEPVDFPVKAVKPIILDAARRAMAHKLFDELGLVGVSKRGDPIVIGTILGPRIGYTRPRMSFFIAWWLDVEAL